MDIKFHHNENLEGNIVLDLLEEDYLPQVDQAIKKYRAKVDLKGFRKGQAPYQLVKKMYGPQILFETVMDLATKTLQDYIKNQQLDLWDNPLMTESSLYNAGIDINNPGTLNFKFEYGLKPQIDFSKLEDIQVETYQISGISEATINQAIKKEQFYHAIDEEIPKSEIGDIVHGTLTNEADYKKYISLPAGTEIGTNGLNFVGLQPQDTLTLYLGSDQSYMVPKDDIHHQRILEALQSLPTGEYQFKVEKISRLILPELNQEFFSKILEDDQVYTLDEFKKQVSDILIDQTQGAADMLIERSIRKAVVDNLAFELPKNFIKKQFMIKFPKWEENIIEDFYQAMEPKLRWNLAISQFAKEHKLPALILEEISSMEKDGDHHELRDKIKEFTDSYDRVLEKKVIETLRDKVSIHTQEKTYEEFGQLVGELQQKK